MPDERYKPKTGWQVKPFKRELSVIERFRDQCEEMKEIPPLTDIASDAEEIAMRLLEALGEKSEEEKDADKQDAETEAA